MTFSYHCIDHVQLAAPPDGEVVARDFYGTILGFQEVEKPESLKKRGGVWFQAGNVALHIGIEQDFTAAKKAHPAIRVENIEALKRDLLKKGAKPQEDDNLPGANRFYLQDPFGNRLEFLEWDEGISISFSQ